MAEIKTLRIDNTEVKVKSSESALPTEYTIESDGKMYCDVINKATISADDVTLTLAGLKGVVPMPTGVIPEYHAIIEISDGEKAIYLTGINKDNIKLNDDTNVDIVEDASHNGGIKTKAEKTAKLELSIQNGYCFVFDWSI